MPASEHPAQSIDELAELIDQDPRAVRLKCGVPHPLSNFAGPNFVDGLFADIVLDFIQDTVWEPEGSMKHAGAVWFLLESESTYFFACAEAGIDAGRLRDHLRHTLP